MPLVQAILACFMIDLQAQVKQIGFLMDARQHQTSYMQIQLV